MVYIDGTVLQPSGKSREVEESLQILLREEQRRQQSHGAGETNLADWEKDLLTQQANLDVRSRSINSRLTKWKAGTIKMNDITLRRLQDESEKIA